MFRSARAICHAVGDAGPVTSAEIPATPFGGAGGRTLGLFSSMRAAIQALRAQEPAAVIVAVPVGSPDTCRVIRAEADEVVCVRTPERFFAVGQAYDDFSPTTDDEVCTVLDAPSDRPRATVPRR